jgi:hypothetical protein
MNELNFAYWLQGFFELTGAETLSEDQVKIIKEHLALVFKKETTWTLGGHNNYWGGIQSTKIDLTASPTTDLTSNIRWAVPPSIC